MNVEEITLNDKEVTEDWEAYVRSEVNSLLDSVLPGSIAGHVGVSYNKVVEGAMEGGAPIYSATKVNGVNILLSFEFGSEVEKSI
ncbi:hypothetical protein JZU46_02970 [bacterium]|nr:hypothetical protein [bacterium]